MWKRGRKRESKRGERKRVLPNLRRGFASEERDGHFPRRASASILLTTNLFVLRLRAVQAKYWHFFSDSYSALNCRSFDVWHDILTTIWAFYSKMVNETRKAVPVQFSDRGLAFPCYYVSINTKNAFFFLCIWRGFSRILKEDEACGENWTLKWVERVRIANS